MPSLWVYHYDAGLFVNMGEQTGWELLPTLPDVDLTTAWAFTVKLRELLENNNILKIAIKMGFRKIKILPRFG